MTNLDVSSAKFDELYILMCLVMVQIRYLFLAHWEFIKTSINYFQAWDTLSLILQNIPELTYQCPLQIQRCWRTSHSKYFPTIDFQYLDLSIFHCGGILVQHVFSYRRDFFGGKIQNGSQIRRKKRIDCQKSGQTQKIEKYKQSLVQFIYPIVYNNVYIPRSSFSNPQNIIISTNTEYISETEMCIIINKTHIYQKNTIAYIQKNG